MGQAGNSKLETERTWSGVPEKTSIDQQNEFYIVRNTILGVDNIISSL
jgi:hypothetical protein